MQHLSDDVWENDIDVGVNGSQPLMLYNILMVTREQTISGVLVQFSIAPMYDDIHVHATKLAEMVGCWTDHWEVMGSFPGKG